jgi:hypothetical protein
MDVRWVAKQLWIHVLKFFGDDLLPLSPNPEVWVWVNDIELTLGKIGGDSVGCRKRLLLVKHVVSLPEFLDHVSGGGRVVSLR